MCVQLYIYTNHINLNLSNILCHGNKINDKRDKTEIHWEAAISVECQQLQFLSLGIQERAVSPLPNRLIFSQAAADSRYSHLSRGSTDEAENIKNKLTGIGNPHLLAGSPAC